MREFSDIERELQLMKFTDSVNGTLYCAPVAPGAPRLIVRRFDGALPPSFVLAYARLLVDAAAWIAADHELANLVRIEQTAEIGCDYIARRHVNATSLDAFLETDEEEDPPEPPSELTRMQTRFRELTTRTVTPREALLTTILGHSILEPSRKTFYDPAAEQFVIADLRPTRGELERWKQRHRMNAISICASGGCGFTSGHQVQASPLGARRTRTFWARHEATEP